MQNNKQFEKQVWKDFQDDSGDLIYWRYTALRAVNRLRASEELVDALLLDQAYQVDKKWYHKLMWWRN